MTTRKPVKAAVAKLVAVISSADDLAAALKLKQTPDLFEIRLDCLVPITTRLERKISGLPSPLIITARDPREGGANKLSLAKRSELLVRFLPQAKYVDVELRAVREFESLLTEAQKRKVGRILSYHNFESTPSSRSLCAKAKRARTLGAEVFKIATRTDAPAALARLIDFTTRCGAGPMAVSAMGIGKLGAISRLLLARCGSALNYGAITQANVEGQLSIDVLRSALTR